MSRRTTLDRLKTKYQFLPEINGQEQADFEADIARNGILQPISITPDYFILDGHRRVGAGIKAGKKDAPILVVDIPEEERALYAIKCNLQRRQLSSTQKQDVIRAALQQRPDLSARQIAERIGSTHPTVSKLRKELEAAGKLKAVEEVVGKDGKRYPIKQVFVEHAKQLPQAIESLKSLPENSRAIWSTRNARQAALKEKWNTPRFTPKDWNLQEGIVLHHKDFQSLSVSEKADLICLDPPWDRDWLPNWNGLVQQAQEWLKPSGWLAVWMPKLICEQVDQVVSQHFDFFHAIVEYFRDASAPVHAALGNRVMSCYRPIHLYHMKGRRLSNDEPLPRAFRDAIESVGTEEKYHKWQQSLGGYLHIIEHFTNPNDVVLDPTFGSGTAAVACAITRRRFLGTELDEQAVQAAMRRLYDLEQNGLANELPAKKVTWYREYEREEMPVLA